jgi:2-oxoglutarate dehydrogenase E2 component (dihydrolipoamide succinyltransferase)
MTDVVLPALGESVTEGTITRWLKKVGDTIAVDEPLVEVSTDKVDTEIPSPVAGVIQKILVQEDETVEVGAILAVIGESAEAAPSAPATPEPEAAPVAPPATQEPVAAPVAAPTTPEPVAAPVAAPTTPEPVAAPVAEPTTPEPVAAPVASPVVAAPTTPEPVAAPVAEPAAAAPMAAAAPPASVEAATPASPKPTESASDTDTTYITPIVRKLANENGIDLSHIKGTGVGGRIRKEDVMEAVSSPAAAAAATSGSKHVVQISSLRGTTESMSRLRKVIAERAVASMQQSAQLTTVVEVDVTNIANMRKKVQADFTQRAGVKLNFMPFFTLATAEALQAHPKINSSVDGETMVYHPSENISFAVDTDRGLLTPVIRDAASLSLAQIAQQISDLALRTRSNQLKPDELSGGTFTLTNTGSRGALFDTPVVFLPQSAILGTGIVTKRPAVVTDSHGNEAIAIRSLVYLALSYDHRIIDGADASRFLTDLKARLEEANFEANLGI